MDRLKEDIRTQLSEIEVLKSIYSNINEFQIEDEEALMDANDFLVVDSAVLTRNIGFVIRFNVQIETTTAEIPLEIVCRLPHSYPTTSAPEIIVRSPRMPLSRRFYDNLNKHIASTHNNDCSILAIIDWIRDNLVLETLKTDDKSGEKNMVKIDDVLTRVWLHFHHVYSTDKRQKLISWAKELDLCGFLMAGKPGMVCAEGTEKNVHEFVIRVKQLPWQKVQIKELQTSRSDGSNGSPTVDNFRKFTQFEEKYFKNQNATTDLGLLHVFLREKNFPNIFNLYFGIDGRETNQVSLNKNKTP